MPNRVKNRKNNVTNSDQTSLFWICKQSNYTAKQHDHDNLD
jgi:hypothetical protein